MAIETLGAADLLEALPEPAIVIDADGQIVAGNRAARKLLATDGEPSGHIVDFLPEEERSRLDPLTWLKRWADRPGAPELAHVRLWCRDRRGVDKAVRVRVGLLPGAEPSYLVMMVDVTEEQARQYRTRSAHRLAARVLAISADAIVNVDETLHIVYANPSAEALFGWPAGGLVGRPLASLLPERFRERHEAFMRAFAADPTPSRLMGQRSEILGLTRGGDEVPLEASITKVTTDRGLVFSAHLRDLRPRKAAEAELDRSRARFQTVFEHARQAMALVTRDGRVEAMNPAARRLLPAGVDPVGQPFAALPFFAADPKGAAEGLATALQQALNGQAYQAEARVRLPDGSERRLDFTLSPVTGNEGTFAVIAEAHDLGGAE